MTTLKYKPKDKNKDLKTFIEAVEKIQKQKFKSNHTDLFRSPDQKSSRSRGPSTTKKDSGAASSRVAEERAGGSSKGEEGAKIENE